MATIDITAPAVPGLLASAPAAEPQMVRFTGNPGEYWRLLIRGAVLLMLTLGIYRFWLATDVRRFLWSNTELQGESLEYTGTPFELLIGFLIAIAILVPLYAGFFVVALGQGPVGQFASVIGFVVLAYLGQIAVYRARRYRLTRTVLRGVRFHQTGAGWRYALRALAWWTLTALTLGLAYPFGQASLERYKVRNTYYGNLQGRFIGSGFGLFFRGLLMWILVIAPLVFAIVFPFFLEIDWSALLAAATSSTNGGADFAKQPGAQTQLLLKVAGVAAGCATASGLLAMILFPAFQALMLRWWIAGLRFGEIEFGSRLRTSQIYGGYLRFIGWSIVLMIALAIIGAVVVGAFKGLVRPALSSDVVEIAAAAGGVISYVAVMLAYSTIYQATAKLTLWRRGVESVVLKNADALDHVSAEGAPSSAVGEGLADALNVGGF